MTLTSARAKCFYDWFGARQDTQEFYESTALELLVAQGDFSHAQHVFELGCGTGRLAQRLLRDFLPPTATYQGVDISETMVSLTQQKIAEYSERAMVSLVSGESELPAETESIDRFVATYVFDLLAGAAIDRYLQEAFRVLQPNGLLCMAGITPGNSILSRIVMRAWKVVFRVSPTIVGGCRPIRMVEHFDSQRWQVKHDSTIQSYGIASEVLIAARKTVSGRQLNGTGDRL